MASVLTKDIYQRLLDRAASERRLLGVGRAVTLGLGALTVLLSLWIAFSRQEALFNTMVTVLGLFMAPTLLPLLAGLAVRRLTWQGALAGFLGGLATGLAMQALKTWWLPSHPNFGSSFDFEGLSLLLNAAVTMLGMLAGTLAFRRPATEEERVRQFFQAMDTPIRPDEVPAKGGSAALPVLGAATCGVGVLLVAAGLLSGSSAARSIDAAFGALLAIIGVLLLRHRTAGKRLA